VAAEQQEQIFGPGGEMKLATKMEKILKNNYAFRNAVVVCSDIFTRL
jgi:hypothetical protein